MSEQNTKVNIILAANKADREQQQIEKQKTIEKLQAEFATLNFEEIRNKDDKELAAWQAQYPPDSPQFIFALQVWNNRALLEQTKWMKRSMWTGFIGIIVGAILTAFIAWLLPPQKSENSVPPQNQSTEYKTDQKAQQEDRQIKAPVGIKKQ